MILAAALLFACSPARSQTINVFAAASLKESFTTIANAFQQRHPGIGIRLNFAGSQLLAAQINNGAPADVFAAADEINLEKIQFIKSTRKVFATNKLVVVLPKTSTINDLNGLSRAVRIVVADEAVPVGRYTRVFLDRAAKSLGSSWQNSVKSRIVSREQDVKSVLAKVQIGEADVGVVYASDAKTAKPPVSVIPIPDSMNVVAQYPVAVPVQSTHQAEAQSFIAFLLTPSSQSVLIKDGFVSPTRRK